MKAKIKSKEKDKILEELKKIRDNISKKDSETNNLEFEIRKKISKTIPRLQVYTNAYVLFFFVQIIKVHI